jgi:putative intracellular protease/amidase
MQIAIVLYPGFTALDVLGPYEILGRLPDTDVVFVAENPGLVSNDLKSLAINVAAPATRRRRPSSSSSSTHRNRPTAPALLTPLRRLSSNAR